METALAVEHGLTPDQYRRTFDLGPDYPMAAPSYRQQRRELALQIGLGQPKKVARKGWRSAGQRVTPQAQREVAAASS